MSKDYFQAKMTTKMIYFWAGPIKITFPQSKSRDKS